MPPYNYYAKEMKLAKEFIINHNYDINFLAMLRECKEGDYIHSERWSKIYDYCEEHYPGVTGTMITGLTHYIEEN